ncbi:hypothetical protein TAMA11512_13160 [Selenomonas sp. TAMA-11512]|uniref:LexA family protein n=1 Tax=Selenomonas sp. TAMA-11512 TaxID=3095337 RepID=UPI0030885552|nr:hypothetical protein TAMA11512_13160 [Selenomonas sp. TAMA-11512]
MTIGSRIREYRKKLDLSVDDVAEKLGKNRATIYRYESDDIENLPASVLEPLAKILQTTPAELMGWKRESIDDFFALPNIEPYNPTMVPVIGSIAAGTPILAAENIEGYAPLQGKNADFALTVKGDSMIGDNIHPGDIVFIRQQPTIEIGEIAAVLIDGDATLKHFYRDSDSVTLVSSNPKYKPMVFRNGDCDEFRILGKAIAYLHDLE